MFTLNLSRLYTANNIDTKKMFFDKLYKIIFQ